TRENPNTGVRRTLGFAPSGESGGPRERQDWADGALADGDLADGKLPLIPPLHVYLTADANRALRLSHSFRLDVRRFDNRPPLLDVGFLKRGKGFRLLLLAWHNLLPDVCQLPTRRRIDQRGRGGGIELGDHALGRPLRDEQPAPDRKVQLRKSRPGPRRDIRC